jgi:hypothetical protein
VKRIEDFAYTFYQQTSLSTADIASIYIELQSVRLIS